MLGKLRSDKAFRDRVTWRLVSVLMFLSGTGVLTVAFVGAFAGYNYALELQGKVFGEILLSDSGMLLFRCASLLCMVAVSSGVLLIFESTLPLITKIKKAVDLRLQSFKKNESGVGWVIGVAIISILLMPFVYFPLSYTFDQFYAVITDGYVFTGVYANAIRVVQIIISYLVIFGILFTLNWAIVQAKSKRYSP